MFESIVEALWPACPAEIRGTIGRPVGTEWSAALVKVILM